MDECVKLVELASVMPKQTVAAYLKSAPKEQQPALEKIRALIREHLPGTKEEMTEYGFAMCTLDDELIDSMPVSTRGSPIAPR